MVRDPRVVFDQLFGVGATPAERAPTAPRGPQHPRLDHGAVNGADAASSVPSDRARLDDYLDDIREIERRIQRVEACNASGEPRELPEAPIGVPDSFDEHVQADVRPAGARVRVATSRACSRSSWGATPRAASYPESGVDDRLPHRLAPQRARGPHRRVREDQPVPRQHGAVFPREAEEHARRRRQPARQHA